MKIKTNLETTTHMGIYSLFGGVLNVLGDVKLVDLMDVIAKMTFSELIGIIVPFMVGFWAIIHPEIGVSKNE